MNLKPISHTSLECGPSSGLLLYLPTKKPENRQNEPKIDLYQRLADAFGVCHWQTLPLPTATPRPLPAVNYLNSVAAGRSPSTPSSLSGLYNYWKTKMGSKLNKRNESQVKKKKEKIIGKKKILNVKGIEHISHLKEGESTEQVLAKNYRRPSPCSYTAISGDVHPAPASSSVVHPAPAFSSDAIEVATHAIRRKTALTSSVSSASSTLLRRTPSDAKQLRRPPSSTLLQHLPQADIQQCVV
ncbi:hypothetical protein LXL04_008750 [Taraxacum kok-saghyz]